MSYINPTVLVPSAPTGLDNVIESIRLNLAQLTWLEKSFGRAWEFKETDVSGNIVVIPKVFQGRSDGNREGEYLNVLPNDSLNAQSFIAAKGPENWSQFNRFEGSMKERKISIIFWVNLKEIDVSKNYIFIDELKGQVEQILSRLPDVKQIDAYYDEKAEDIFHGYSVKEVKTQYLMYPYAGMRFDLTVAYPEVCDGNPDVVLLPVSVAYKEYFSILNQSGMLVPVDSNVKNTTGATLTWAYNGAGDYTITASSPIFTANKTFVTLGIGYTAAGVIANYEIVSTTAIRIRTTLPGAGMNNGFLINASFKIEIYQ